MSSSNKWIKVSGWLTGIGLEFALVEFQKKGITTPELLASLELPDYEEVGITQMMDRKKLFYLINRIKMAVETDRSVNQSLASDTNSSSSQSQGTFFEEGELESLGAEQVLTTPSALTKRIHHPPHSERARHLPSNYDNRHQQDEQQEHQRIPRPHIVRSDSANKVEHSRRNTVHNTMIPTFQSKQTNTHNSGNRRASTSTKDTHNSHGQEGTSDFGQWAAPRPNNFGFLKERVPVQNLMGTLSPSPLQSPTGRKAPAFRKMSSNPEAYTSPLQNYNASPEQRTQNQRVSITLRQVSPEKENQGQSEMTGYIQRLKDGGLSRSRMETPNKGVPAGRAKNPSKEQRKESQIPRAETSRSRQSSKERHKESQQMRRASFDFREAGVLTRSSTFDFGDSSDNSEDIHRFHRKLHRANSTSAASMKSKLRGKQTPELFHMCKRFSRLHQSAINKLVPMAQREVVLFSGLQKNKGSGDKDAINRYLSGIYALIHEKNNVVETLLEELLDLRVHVSHVC